MKKKTFLFIIILLIPLCPMATFNYFQSVVAMERSEFIPTEGIAPGPQGPINEKPDPMFNEQVDYSLFSGRITDRDQNNHIYKIKSNTKNVKYLRAGDKVDLWINQSELDDEEINKIPEKRKCAGNVHGQEQDYFVIYIEYVEHCNDLDNQTQFLRIGTRLNFYVPVLYQRVLQASQYRNVLLDSKKDFLQQLNDINHFLWSFNEQQMSMIAEFDIRIASIQKEKQKQIDDMLLKKKEKIFLQKELIEKLNRLDESLKFYRLDLQDDLSNRWRNDHDLGLPMMKRPVDAKVPSKIPQENLF